VTLVQPGGLQQMERGAEGSGTLVCTPYTFTLIWTNAQAGRVTLCASQQGWPFRSDTIGLFRGNIQAGTFQFDKVVAR